MRVGQIATFKEIFHYMEQECGGVFTTVISPPKGAEHKFYIFHAMDKNICLVALKTDWAFIDSIFKDYKGDWCYNNIELFRVCRIMPLSDAIFEIAVPEDSELWNPEKGYHWIVKHNKEGIKNEQ